MMMYEMGMMDDDVQINDLMMRCRDARGDETLSQS